ncbi:MAG TPA: trypsin-like peptidase domain-containing protein [Terriglobia bacterium]|nr:trypsin-like peptidase domain-containing protein [Terriglobia bacterium]
MSTGLIYVLWLLQTLDGFGARELPKCPGAWPTTVVSTEAAFIHQLADPKGNPVRLTGRFQSAATWSGDGRWLFLANSGGGLQIYANELTAAEKTVSETWWKSLPKRTAPAPAQPVDAESLTWVSSFQPSSDKTVVMQALTVAMEEGRKTRSLEYERFPQYRDNKAAIEEFQQISSNTRQSEPGVRIYRFRQSLQKYPDFAPMKAFLANALRDSGQMSEAKDTLLEVIQQDAGRTNLTDMALSNLADMWSSTGDDLKAIHCLAIALRLDQDNPRIASQALPLLKKNGFDAAVAFASPRAGGDANRRISESTSSRLPTLDDPPAKTASLDPSAVYERAAPSTVMIETDEGSGSGVCVGKDGVILTNRHVVRGNAEVKVYTYVYEKGKARRLEAHRAAVVYESQDQDLAILIMDRPPATLKPLTVALETPKTGAKVFAIGSPGMGDQILDQSISEGIVSSPSRAIDGANFIQHTAAVNPGNSGGPLLNDRAQVVGIVTFKANLQNVSFAIPAEAIRTLFSKTGAARPN